MDGWNERQWMKRMMKNKDEWRENEAKDERSERRVDGWMMKQKWMDWAKDEPKDEWSEI